MRTVDGFSLVIVMYNYLRASTMMAVVPELLLIYRSSPVGGLMQIA